VIVSLYQQEHSPLEQTLSRLRKLHPKVIELSLNRVRRLLLALGSPQDKVKKVIHVAGTNGKGSTIANMQAILEESGYLVHSYTSPHLISFTERICVAGTQISLEELNSILCEVELINANNSITFFEIVTAAAFLAFSRTRADILLLETGLGGRLDATNVVLKPLVTALTPIDIDHTDYLGNNIASIAEEKAGIIKSGAKCVSAVQYNDADNIIHSKAREELVSVSLQNRDWEIKLGNNQCAYFQNNSNSWELSRLPLVGPHQLTNLGVALESLSSLPFEFDERSIKRGMLNVDWPGRCQRIVAGPLLSYLPPAWELWIDGAHNISGARALSSWLDSDNKTSVVICGILSNKDARSYFEVLSSSIEELATISIPDHAGASSHISLAATAREAGIKYVFPSNSIENAMKTLCNTSTQTPRRILICGSLYLAGYILQNHS